MLSRWNRCVIESFLPRVKKTDFLVYMQARDMMCRYESRALSASVIGNKSFRFRISALIWSRRALDAPLVERYMVVGSSAVNYRSSELESSERSAAEGLGCGLCLSDVFGDSLEEKLCGPVIGHRSYQWFQNRPLSDVAPPQRPALMAGRLLDLCPPQERR